MKHALVRAVPQCGLLVVNVFVVARRREGTGQLISKRLALCRTEHARADLRIAESEAMGRAS